MAQNKFIAEVFDSLIAEDQGLAGGMALCRSLFIARALLAAKGNVSEAARKLKISRSGLYQWLAENEVEQEYFAHKFGPKNQDWQQP